MEATKSTTAVNIHVPKDTYAILKLLAQRQRRSLKQQCVIILEQFIANQAAQVPKSQAPEAE